MRKRIAKLERELARKERALAEAATLLVLRDPLENRVRREEQDLDDQAEEAEALNHSLPARPAFAEAARDALFQNVPVVDESAPVVLG